MSTPLPQPPKSTAAPAPGAAAGGAAKRRRRASACALAALFAATLGACGGGGGDDAAATPPAPPPPASGTVAVTASLGAVFNADVSVVCAPTGATLGSDSTGTSGQVNVATSGDCAGPVLVVVAARADGSSTYFDEALNSPAPFPAGSTLRAVAPSFASPMTLGVTPLTEIATRRALEAAGNTLASLSAAQVGAANTAVVTQVLGAGVTLDILSPPTLWRASTAPGSLGTSQADRYAFYLAGLARMALGMPAPALTVTSALGADLADGVLNGASSGSFSYTAGNLGTQLSAGLNAMASFANSALQSALGLSAATPVAIASFTPVSGDAGSTVTLAGSGFDADPARLRVKFSTDVTATVVSSTPTSVVVQVPAGAVTGPISVTNLATSLNATSGTAFTVTTPPPVTLPAVPGNVLATPVSASQIQLSWGASVGAASYNVYRSTSAGVAIVAGNQVNTSPVVPTSFTDTGLAAGTTYFYKVTAANTAGESVGSSEFSAATLAANALAWHNATASRESVVYDRAFFLNGKFVTVRTAGVLSQSTDGATWTSAVTGSTDTIKDLVFGNGRYVALVAVPAGGGSFNYLLRGSADGTTWSTLTLPPTAATMRPAAILFANGKFTAIAAGLNGSFGAQIVSSTDGITWTEQTASTFWNDVGFLAYGNGVYVAAGGVVQVSSDGLNWTMPVTSQTPPNQTRFLNGGFIMVGNNGLIRTSANGSTWTTRTSGTTRNLNDVAFGNGLLAIAGSFNSLTGTGTLMTSADAASWTLNDLTAVAPIQNLNGIAFGNGRFVAAGSLGALITSP